MEVDTPSAVYWVDMPPHFYVDPLEWIQVVEEHRNLGHMVLNCDSLRDRQLGFICVSDLCTQGDEDTSWVCNVTRCVPRDTRSDPFWTYLHGNQRLREFVIQGDGSEYMSHHMTRFYHEWLRKWGIALDSSPSESVTIPTRFERLIGEKGSPKNDGQPKEDLEARVKALEEKFKTIAALEEKFNSILHL